MHRRAPMSSTRRARKAPCSGAICMPCWGSAAVSSRSRARMSGSLVPTSTTYAASSSEMPIVLLAMLDCSRARPSVRELGGDGDRIHQCAVAQHRDLHPGADGLLEHEALQGLRVAE